MSQPSAEFEEHVRRARSVFLVVGAMILIGVGGGLLMAGYRVVGSAMLAVAGILFWKSGPIDPAPGYAETGDPDDFEEGIDELPGRVRCECCGSPTIQPLYDVDCLLCGWDPELAAEMTLHDARRNFRRYLSVYAPERRPDWDPDPPAIEVLHLKRELIELYAAALVEDDAERKGVWYAIDEKELELRRLTRP